MIEYFKITKIRGGKRQTAEDTVVREIPLTIIVDDTELVTLLCCPNDLEDLVTGFLFTSGLIKGKEEIKRVVISRDRWIANVDLIEPRPAKDLIFKRLYTSGCGRGTMFYNVSDIAHRSIILSDFTIEAVNINNLMTEFQRRSEVYLRTGGVHGAALSDGKAILFFKEDIGRHNAIDKVIGHLLADKEYFENKMMITSGRISSEVLFKAQKCRIPIIVSRSSPTNQAVRLARDMRITLVGFARGNRMNVYSQEDRIRCVMN